LAVAIPVVTPVVLKPPGVLVVLKPVVVPVVLKPPVE
jgi:hypothetical protein